MEEEIAFENRRISGFQELLTLNFTLDRVILHTVVHHSSTSAYIQNFIEVKGTFCGQMDGRTYGGHLRPTLLGRLRRVDLIIGTTNNVSLSSFQAYRNPCCFPKSSNES